jgi:hypothetical protein
MNLDDLELEIRKLPGIRWAAFSDLGDRLLVQLHAMQEARSDVALEASRIAARHCELPIAVDLVRWLPPPKSAEHTMLRSNGSAAPPPPPPPVPPAPPTSAAPPARPAPQSFPSFTSLPSSSSSGPSSWFRSLAPVAAAPSHPAAPPPPAWQEPRLEILGLLTLADTDEIEVHLTDGAARTIGRASRRHGLLGAVEATLEAVRGFPITIELPVAPEWARPIQSTAGGRSVVAVALARLGREECYGLASGSGEVEAAAGATLDALHRNLRPARRDGSA